MYESLTDLFRIPQPYESPCKRLPDDKEDETTSTIGSGDSNSADGTPLVDQPVISGDKEKHGANYNLKVKGFRNP